MKVYRHELYFKLNIDVFYTLQFRDDKVFISLDKQDLQYVTPKISEEYAH